MTAQPQIADSPRISAYAPVNSVGPFAVGFPLFDATGADLLVTINGFEVSNWVLTVDIAAGFYGAPNTWLNGRISFASPITGALVITGRRRPRRTGQFAEGRGAPARDMNTELNILTAGQREIFDALTTLKAGLADDFLSVLELLAPVLPKAPPAQAGKIWLNGDPVGGYVFAITGSQA